MVLPIENNLGHWPPLYSIVECELLPTLTGRPPPNNAERKLTALPARLGSLGIPIPSLQSTQEVNASLRVTAPLQKLILEQEHVYAFGNQVTAKSDIRRERRETTNQTATDVREELPPALRKAMDLASVPHSSSWQTSLPIKEHGFCLHNGAFIDALELRYGWAPP